MKKILGTAFIVIGIGCILCITFGWAFSLLSLAVRLIEPVLLLCLALVMALIGIYMRDDK